MCGIFGVIGGTNSQELFEVSKALSHRGPDDEGFCSIPELVHFKGKDSIKELNFPNLEGNFRAAFGHRRLSIIDLSPRSHQPMEREKYLLTFNGEIYNYKEIRRELESLGHTFTSVGDAEVVICAYIQWGEMCVEHFNGMWAFAIWDPRRRIVFASRDRLGIKPFVYFHSGKYFAFASEQKALLKFSHVPKRPNIANARRYLVWGMQNFFEDGMFGNIKRLLPANNLVFDIESGKLTTYEYWKIVPNIENPPYDEKRQGKYSDKFKEIFTKAVKLRLTSDVKVGTALSGGIDSSSNVYTINELMKKRHIPSVGESQYTFSAVYGDYKADESKWINVVVGDTNIRSIRVIPEFSDLIKSVEKLAYIHDEPFDSTSTYAQWRVMSLPRKHGVIVTLDGQGGDEIAGGYPLYLPIMLVENFLNTTFFREFKNLEKANASKRLFFRTLGTRILKEFSQRVYFKKMITGLFNHEINFIPYGGRAKAEFSHLNLRAWSDVREELVDLLKTADRNAMSFSIESRFPYLDHKLVEYAMSVPAVYKIHNGWTKYLSRQAFRGLINEKILWREDKLGFPTPQREWFESGLENFCKRYISNSAFLKALDVNSNGTFDHKILWRLTNLAAWARVFNF